VGGVGVFGGVEHPEVFEAEAFMHCLPGFWAGGLVCAVIHDGDAGVIASTKAREFDRLKP